MDSDVYVWKPSHRVLQNWRGMSMGIEKFVTYMNEATPWQNMELISSMLSFLTIELAILLCLCHRRMQQWWHWHCTKFSLSTGKIQPIYGKIANHDIFPLPPFLSKEEEEEEEEEKKKKKKKKKKKNDINHDFLYLTCFDLHNPRYFHMYLEKIEIQTILDVSLLPTVSSFKLVIRSHTSGHFRGNYEHSQFKNSLGIFWTSCCIFNQTKTYSKIEHHRCLDDAYML